eukprot:Rmarinus@m.13553
MRRATFPRSVTHHQLFPRKLPFLYCIRHRHEKCRPLKLQFLHSLITFWVSPNRNQNLLSLNLLRLCTPLKIKTLPYKIAMKPPHPPSAVLATFSLRPKKEPTLDLTGVISKERPTSSTALEQSSKPTRVTVGEENHSPSQPSTRPRKATRVASKRSLTPPPVATESLPTAAAPTSQPSSPPVETASHGSMETDDLEDLTCAADLHQKQRQKQWQDLHRKDQPKSITRIDKSRSKARVVQVSARGNQADSAAPDFSTSLQVHSRLDARMSVDQDDWTRTSPASPRSPRPLPSSSSRRVARKPSTTRHPRQTDEEVPELRKTLVRPELRRGKEQRQELVAEPEYSSARSFSSSNWADTRTAPTKPDTRSPSASPVRARFSDHQLYNRPSSPARSPSPDAGLYSPRSADRSRSPTHYPAVSFYDRTSGPPSPHDAASRTPIRSSQSSPRNNGIPKAHRLQSPRPKMEVVSAQLPSSPVLGSRSEPRHQDATPPVSPGYTSRHNIDALLSPRIVYDQPSAKSPRSAPSSGVHRESLRLATKGHNLQMDSAAHGYDYDSEGVQSARSAQTGPRSPRRRSASSIFRRIFSGPGELQQSDSLRGVSVSSPRVGFSPSNPDSLHAPHQDSQNLRSYTWTDSQSAKQNAFARRSRSMKSLKYVMKSAREVFKVPPPPPTRAQNGVVSPRKPPTGGFRRTLSGRLRKKSSTVVVADRYDKRIVRSYTTGNLAKKSMKSDDDFHEWVRHLMRERRRQEDVGKRLPVVMEARRFVCGSDGQWEDNGATYVRCVPRVFSV